MNAAIPRSKIETNVNVTKAYYQVLVSNEQIRLLDANIEPVKTTVGSNYCAKQTGIC